MALTTQDIVGAEPPARPAEQQVKLRALRGVMVGGQAKVSGDVFDVPASLGIELVSTGKAEPYVAEAQAPAPKPAGKAASKSPDV